jgi:hypothetical protein
MTIRRVLFCAAVSALVAAVGYAARGHVPVAPPAIDFPETIELGELDQGQVVSQGLSISNRGGSPLQIGNVRTNCSCSGLEREVEGTAESVTELTIPPGEAVDLRVRLAVRGTPGLPLRTTLAFGTNDPLRPVGQIDLVVSRIRGVASNPTAVVFGTVPVGRDPQQVVELRDLAGDRLAVERVSCSDTERFAARVLPNDENSPNLVRIEVTARTAASGTASGEMRVEVNTTKGQKTVVVPVTARVVAPVEASPSRVCLPRSSAGGPLYHATCVCRSASGKPMKLTPEGVAQELSVVVSGAPDGSSAQLVRIEWVGPRGDAEIRERVLRLKASVESDEYPVEIRVTCKQSGAE